MSSVSPTQYIQDANAENLCKQEEINGIRPRNRSMTLILLQQLCDLMSVILASRLSLLSVYCIKSCFQCQWAFMM